MPRGQKKNIIGHRFGRLTAIEDCGRRNRKVLWRCICDCGKEVIVEGCKLRSGHTKSCGCYKKYILTRNSGKRNPMYGKKHTEERKKVIGDFFRGRAVSQERNEKIRERLKGRIFSDEHKRKISLSRVGDKNPAWKGGVSTEDRMLRSSLRLRNWRSSVFQRDNYSCVECGCTRKVFNAHHVKSWKNYPELRFNIDNGITLCVNCHRKKHPRNEAYIGKYVQLPELSICSATI